MRHAQALEPLAGAAASDLFALGLLAWEFVLSPLALIDKRPGVTFSGVLRNWGLVFVGNFAGAVDR